MGKLPVERTKKKIAWGAGIVVGVGVSVAMLVSFGRDTVAWAKARPEYLFDPARVALGDASPRWLEPEMAQAFFADYLAVAGAPFSLLDDAALEQYLGHVRALPWIRELRAKRMLPNELAMDFELRRPVAAAFGARDRGAEVWLFAADGSRLGRVRLAQPLPAASRRDGVDLPSPVFGIPWLIGASAEKQGGLALRLAARIVPIYRDQVRPRVREGLRDPLARIPTLVAVDASNFGYVVDPTRGEFSLLVRCSDGETARLEWGHAPGTQYRVTPWHEKAKVLVKILTARKGLAAVLSADLRYKAGWRRTLVLRSGQ